ncbi:hypothetical protein AV530_003165 [Patagioenas fasciata monilis]|uniref:Uncharacterized protein n=1 Tax=Patagioenas fasciata monilis TaxID=372326 RepID=A0A1V4KW41_PATFA|nr:hypothetical protein AV530_003165 [Patagioenas fasciata monilis]
MQSKACGDCSEKKTLQNRFNRNNLHANILQIDQFQIPYQMSYWEPNEKSLGPAENMYMHLRTPPLLIVSEGGQIAHSAANKHQISAFPRILQQRWQVSRWHRQVLGTKRCILQLPISIWIGPEGSKRVQQPLGLRENKETNFRENSSNQTRCEPAENTREEEPLYTNEVPSPLCDQQLLLFEEMRRLLTLENVAFTQNASEITQSTTTTVVFHQPFGFQAQLQKRDQGEPPLAASPETRKHIMVLRIFSKKQQKFQPSHPHLCSPPPPVCLLPSRSHSQNLHRGTAQRQVKTAAKKSSSTSQQSIPLFLESDKTVSLPTLRNVINHSSLPVLAQGLPAASCKGELKCLSALQSKQTFSTISEFSQRPVKYPA